MLSQGGNPLHGVKRPRIETNEGKTPALCDDQAKLLLSAADGWTLKGTRERAILAVLLYHGLSREEALQLQTGDLQERRGIKHLKVKGKGGKPAIYRCTRLRPSVFTITWNGTINASPGMASCFARFLEPPPAPVATRTGFIQ